ncbi:MAG: tRNA glutamyl-Q(34) synthetase GluQRS [Gammaproteobacteria bacterium AqS3]|nr:tRNA glutamyl-Q(34) synthetase GluQRS [Gammaproteobacteria bacterium AqS3]
MSSPPQSESAHIFAVGSGLTDIEFRVEDGVLERLGLEKGAMSVADADQQRRRLNQLSSFKLRPQIHCGGSAVNSLYAARAMGAGTTLATRLGSDTHGRNFLRDLRHCGIACDARLQRGAVSGTCLALITPDAERTMSTHLGVNTEINADDLRSPALNSTWLVYIEGYLVFIDAMVEALCGMRLRPDQRFILSLSDPGVVTGGGAGLRCILDANRPDLLFGNEQEFQLLTGEQSIQNIAGALAGRNWAGQFVMTRGSLGAVIGERGAADAPFQITEVPTSRSVKAIDTLGAGDSFAGAFMYAMVCGRPLVQCAQFANGIAGELVRHFGPRLDAKIYWSLADRLLTPPPVKVGSKKKTRRAAEPDRASGSTGYRGRFAPSPSGPLHLGSLVSALASFLHARARDGEWCVRIEDIDVERSIPGADTEILGALEVHGLHWDGKVRTQSDGLRRFAEAERRLLKAGLLYRCSCSRAQRVTQASCKCRTDPPDDDRPTSLRLRFDRLCTEFGSDGAEPVFEDDFCGPQYAEPLSDDPIIRRRDGGSSYLLANAVDDALDDITWVVRGEDLLSTTPAQVMLLRALDHSVPRYAHHSLAVDKSGRKLSKQNQARPLDLDRPALNLRRALGVLGLHPPNNINSHEALISWGLDQFAASR